MSNPDHLAATIVIVVCFLWMGCSVVVVGLAARAKEIAAEDDHYARQRTPGMGEFRPAQGRPHIAEMQARAETPADSEWERRLARWTAAAHEEDQRRKGQA